VLVAVQVALIPALPLQVGVGQIGSKMGEWVVLIELVGRAKREVSGEGAGVTFHEEGRAVQFCDRVNTVPINGPMLPDLVDMRHNPGVVKPLGIPIPQFLAFEQDSVRRFSCMDRKNP